MNCGQPVPQAQAKFFASVFLCATCGVQAESFFKRCEKELRHLLAVSKESIRIALISGKFSYPDDSQEVSKKAVLEQVLRMENARDEQKGGNAGG